MELILWLIFGAIVLAGLFYLVVYKGKKSFGGLIHEDNKFMPVFGVALFLFVLAVLLGSLIK